MQRIGGMRRKTRHKLSKGVRSQGKLSLTRFFQEFKEGDAVCLSAEPAVQRGMYFPRFHGKVARVKKRKGDCYYVSIKDGNKRKDLLVHPVHLKKV